MTQARLALGQIDQARAFIGDLEKYHPNYLKTQITENSGELYGKRAAESALQEANELIDAVKKAYPNAETDGARLGTASRSRAFGSRSWLI